MIKQFYLTEDGAITNTTDLDQSRSEIKAMKGYYTIFKVPGLKPRHQTQFSVIQELSLGLGFILYRDEVGEFHCPSRYGNRLWRRKPQQSN